VLVAYIVAGLSSEI